MSKPYLRLRKTLSDGGVAPDWPEGVRPVRFETVAPARIHSVLLECFPGDVASLADWYGNLTSDDEFDADLCVPVVTGDGSVAGFVQCWTSNFVKDLAVAPAYRGIGLGAALMEEAFSRFSKRGAIHVDLKVKRDAAPARRLYKRLGMVEATE